MKSKMYLWVVGLLICLCLVGCGGNSDATPAPNTATPESGAIGMANPASVFCEAQGGRVDIRETADGQQDFCVFDDGSECDEWAFFRGECSAPASDATTPETGAIGMANPASVFCEAQGGRVDIRETADGQVGYCIFDDGSECDEWAFFRGECGAHRVDDAPQSGGGQESSDPAGSIQANRLPDTQGMEAVPLLGMPAAKDATNPAPAMNENSGVTPVSAPVEDWQGVVVSNPEGAQFDDYFQLLDQNGTRFGITGNDEISAQLAALRDTGIVIHVWGILHYNVPDAYGTQIEVARLEISTPN